MNNWNVPKVLLNDMRRHVSDVESNKSEKTLEISKEILDIILSEYTGPVSIRLWNGDVAVGNKNTKCTIIFNKQYPLRELFLRKDLTCLLEAFLCGDVDVDGNIEALFSLLDYIENINLPLTRQIKFLVSAVKLPKNDSRESLSDLKAGSEKKKNCKDSIGHHYDVGNEFYGLFLDPEMVYSCAYFKDNQQSLAEAQRDKLDYICRKIRLKPGMKLLDIGCGWGGLAIWAAQYYDVCVHGITLSVEQYKYALSRINQLNLNKKIKIELLDYRELPDDVSYDRIVSVGMFEHIGIKNFPIYFNIIKGLLKPDGLFLNHGITNDSGWLQTPITRFINNYIFPDGELTRISTVTTAMENAGFEIIDCEGLRPHYVLTLRKWVESIERNRTKAVKKSDDATHRLWRLYMTGCAYYFNKGDTGIYQILACNNQQSWFLPLRRDNLYRNNSCTNK